MLNKWFVIRMTVNMSNGNAEEIKRFDTEKEAMDSFYNQLSSYGTNPATKVCLVTVVNPSGGTVKYEMIDNTPYIAPETPEEVTEE